VTASFAANIQRDIEEVEMINSSAAAVQPLQPHDSAAFPKQCFFVDISAIFWRCRSGASAILLAMASRP
jgi:hypothetical protein